MSFAIGAHRRFGNVWTRTQMRPEGLVVTCHLDDLESRLYQLMELSDAGRREPREMLAATLRIVERQMYAVIRARRNDPGHHGWVRVRALTG